MTAPRPLPPCPAQPGASVRVQVARLTVHGASGIQARRLAEALPAALERAVAAWTEGRAAPAPHPGLPGLADAAAAQAVAQIARRGGGERP